jgi:hypothetical protein
MRPVLILGAALFAVLLSPLSAQAQDQEPKLEKAKVEAAIKKGLAWIKARQAADGSFDEGYKSQFPIGPTALAGLTLIKGGDDPKSVELRKAFHYLARTPYRRTYGTGILLMAIEALYAPTKQQLEAKPSPFKTAVRKRFKKAKGPHKKLLFSGAQWLLKTKHAPMWGYPFGGSNDAFQTGGKEWDHSNTQYALLGLASAKRLGFKLPGPALFSVLDQMLAGQQKSGPKVKPFFVPAAEVSFKNLDKLAKDLAKYKINAKKGKPDDTVTRVREFHETYKPGPMFARGWAYFPVGEVGSGPPNNHPAGKAPQLRQAGPSMTAASLAIVILLKAALEDQGKYRKRYQRRVDQAIRDGAAYLAKNWTLTDPGHPYYYLYGLERVGVLTGVHRFGDHWWFHEGGKKLLSSQNADGSWGNASPVAQGGIGQPLNALPQTCFSVLFLSRATVPLVPKLPPRPRTGRGK